jgi:hypothetical protein
LEKSLILKVFDTRLIQDDPPCKMERAEHIEL